MSYFSQIQDFAMILTKLESPHLDLPIWRYTFYKIALKLEYLNYPIAQRSLTRGTCGLDDPTVQRKEIGEAACDGAAAAKLADGGFTGNEEGTSVTATTSRIDWCPNRALY